MFRELFETTIETNCRLVREGRIKEARERLSAIIAKKDKQNPEVRKKLREHIAWEVTQGEIDVNDQADIEEYVIIKHYTEEIGVEEGLEPRRKTRRVRRSRRKSSPSIFSAIFVGAITGFVSMLKERKREKW